jgi:hypothetical protein
MTPPEKQEKTGTFMRLKRRTQHKNDQTKSGRSRAAAQKLARFQCLSIVQIEGGTPY